jgi:DNA-directed RNA polymerase specialized sigma24 family protein
VGLEAGSDRSTRLVSSLDFEHVYRALDKVDPLGARIVRHKHFDHLTIEEIATRLGMPASSAKTHYQRSLARLREILDPLRRESGL